MTILEDKQNLQRQETRTPPAAGVEVPAGIAVAMAEENLAIPPLGADAEAPPSYGDAHHTVEFAQPGYATSAAVTGKFDQAFQGRQILANLQQMMAVLILVSVPKAAALRISFARPYKVSWHQRGKMTFPQHIFLRVLVANLVRLPHRASMW
jgi:hypothetical protein